MSAEKFDTKQFINDLTEVINRYSENGNQFTNAEIVSGLTSVYTETLKQAINNKAGKYLMQKIIDSVFDELNE